MAKRGRRSIRNKRKSVKKHSHKRRSKTMRYLRGGVYPDSIYNQLSPEEQKNTIMALQRAHQEKIARMTPEELAEFYNSSDDDDDDGDMGGGRRRYHRRKQSKSRSKSRKH